MSSEEDVDDVIQDILGGLSTPGGLASFLAKRFAKNIYGGCTPKRLKPLVGHHAYHYAKRKCASADARARAHVHAQMSPVSATQVDLEDLIPWSQDCLRVLTPRKQKIVALWLNGHNATEIAKMTGLTGPTYVVRVIGQAKSFLAQKILEERV